MVCWRLSTSTAYRPTVESGAINAEDIPMRRSLETWNTSEYHATMFSQCFGHYISSSSCSCYLFSTILLIGLGLKTSLLTVYKVIVKISLRAARIEALEGTMADL